MGKLWPLTLTLYASWYFQQGFCGSISLDHELLLGLGPARPRDPLAWRSGRETLFGPRRMALQQDTSCVTSIFVCPNNQILSTQAYASIVKGPCTPVPGLDLVQCGTTLSSREAVQSVLVGTCEVKCRDQSGSLRCPSELAQPPAQTQQGMDRLSITKRPTCFLV